MFDSNNNFVGVVYLRDIKKVSHDELVGKFITRGSPYVSLNSSIEQALKVMANNKARWVAVVEGNKLIGIVTYDSIVETYSRTLKKIRKPQ